MMQVLHSPADEHWAIAPQVEVLSRIYDEAVTIAICQRQLEKNLENYIAQLLRSNHKLSLKLSGTPAVLINEVNKILPAGPGHVLLVDDIKWLLEMFACLFECTRVGLRINTLDSAMCPRFHVDRVPVRLVTTYGGPGTEWLPNSYAMRTAAGAVVEKLRTENAASLPPDNMIQHIDDGDIALLKGELWSGNEGRGLIHRSPALTSVTGDKSIRRLLMTFDLISD